MVLQVTAPCDVLSNCLSHRVHQLHDAETQGHRQCLVTVYHSVQVAFKALGDGSFVGM